MAFSMNLLKPKKAFQRIGLTAAAAVFFCSATAEASIEQLQLEVIFGSLFFSAARLLVT